jgi:hypothetical protein
LLPSALWAQRKLALKKRTRRGRFLAQIVRIGSRDTVYRR